MDYTEIINIKHLANELRCTTEFIESLINEGCFITENIRDDWSKIYNLNSNQKAAVQRFYIPKKNKALGYRVIHKPITSNLSNTLKILNGLLFSVYKPIENVHGFVKDRNIKTNADLHLGKKYILTLDIKDFFESISSKMIENSLIDLGFKKDVAYWISKIVTINDFLVQGYHTSPTIANIVAKNMDIKLRDICSYSITYTRYADDMYFSSNDAIPNIDIYKKEVENFGFEINNAKTKLMKRGQKQYVTGLTVFDAKFPRIPKLIKRNLRLEIHYISKYGYEEHILKKLGYKKHQLKNPQIRDLVYDEVDKTKLKIWGWIHFIKSIEPQYGNKIENQLRKKINFC